MTASLTEKLAECLYELQSERYTGCSFADAPDDLLAKMAARATAKEALHRANIDDPAAMTAAPQPAVTPWSNEMSKAPRDGTLIDLWVLRYGYRGAATRVCDVRFDKDEDGEGGGWMDRFGNTIVLDEPMHEYDPRATHWMRTTPPTASSGEG